MTENARGIKNWTILAVVIGLLAFSGLAMAQDANTADTDEGPPWAQEGVEFTPGENVGPPAWATGEGDHDGEGPPWLSGDFEGDWTPGTPGPPAWATGEGVDGDMGPPWLRFDVGGWTPGTPGPPPWEGSTPPWADGSDDDGEGPPPWAGTGRGDGATDE